ncbi:MAG: rod shape-determining protein [Clostridia bacterium]|nr:rod shape-determining protein [Clostridia bacterium]MBP5269826.1 rod shape-determining protein [Clostridia bacterium]
MSKQLGIDLGTSNTLVYMKGKGIVLNEPSVVATDLQKSRVVVGDDARKMIGRTPDSIEAKRPLQNGVIADFDVTARMLKEFFKKVGAVGIISRPAVAIAVPSVVTEVEKRAVEDATYEADAKEVLLVMEPIAAAIGSGLKVDGPRGSMIVDIGGGISEAAVISLNGIVVKRSTPVAGNSFDEAIIHYMRREHQVLIGNGTAEALKRTVGSVHPSADRGETEIRGRDLKTGLARIMTVSSGQIREALKEPVNIILSMIKATLENTPPELSADILDYGIVLTGGGSLLGGLKQIISEKTGVRVTVAKKPAESVALGLGRMLENPADGYLDFRGR